MCLISVHENTIDIQGSKDDKLMYIPNDEKQNYPFFRLKLLVDKLKHCNSEPTNQNIIRIPKLWVPL